MWNTETTRVSNDNGSRPVNIAFRHRTSRNYHMTPQLCDFPPYMCDFLSDLLQPVPPCVSLRESVQVYKEHCRMAREFHQVKNEISVLEDRKRKLLAELVEDEKVAMEIARLEEEFRRLTEENRTLVTVHKERAKQLERLCLNNRTRQDSS
uniref:Map3k7 C-terminal like n=1 Tax=Amphilophus citrinellus TaxID=61819 RepID=A0A3Q0RIY7_AMPCI